MADRSPPWSRSELILALDFYMREGHPNPRDPRVKELSDLLNRLPIHPPEVRAKTFRNASGVAMKLGNFQALDPGHIGVGLSRGGKGDRLVWDEFAGDYARLAATANAIVEASQNSDLPQWPTEEERDPDVAAPEGEILFRWHQYRERNAGAVERKKREAFASGEPVLCEVCGFDFAATYGERGEGYIECHHRLALSEGGRRRLTRQADLALVCANCHRMIHRRKPWPTPEQLAATL